jgi:Ion channel
MTPSSETVWVAAHRHLIMLAGVVALQVVQPLFAHGSVLNRVVYDAAFGVVMVLVSFAILTQPRDRWIAAALMAPAIAANVAHYALPQSSQWLAATVFHAASAGFLGFAVAVILGRILRQRVVSGDDVLGAIAGWVLMGLIWGHLFALTDRLVPNSFTISAAITGELDEWHSRRALFDYFSFTTLTSLGYGDITPTRAPAYTLAWLEVMFGGFYMAIIVAQLVGMKLVRAQDSEDR